MYVALKHIHLFTIALSVTLFIIRFVWRMMDSKMLEKKWVKVVPHVIDTALLLTGISLVVITGFTPFTPGAVWMTEKLTCVFAYIALGFVALNYSQGTLFRLFAFFGALGWVYAAANLAITKTPQLLG
ncbi:invasion protein [Enterovibrio norvegicus]|uniref:Invasion protein n=2 Tax=Enterovibrio norvegicus TaxID=188144 RepID=A0A2N7LI09_9GAMM|nr:SirB2 family protein [Enterovibrio norvegicus]MCC4801012.1 SirB2 family protein [Enterovibrio norvegicus]OEE61136.1 invasion protein [Enterovibrio norvegicus]OEF55049.1 invasion protein [Enterovibrio norvegicus]OEF61390.1 invasion protein [Enterovibrio norvegicus]PMH64964.1 invasion protein [Enterovibrio norvegicus]